MITFELQITKTNNTALFINGEKVKTFTSYEAAFSHMDTVRTAVLTAGIDTRFLTNAVDQKICA
jgi:hypothetical protein